MINSVRKMVKAILLITATTTYGITMFWCLKEVLLFQASRCLYYSILLALLLLLAFFLNDFSSKEKNERINDFILLLIAAGLIPSIPFFNYISHNWNNFDIAETIPVSMAMFFISVTIFLVVCRLINERSAILVVIFVSAIFWIYPFVSEFFSPRYYFFLAIAVLAITIITTSKYPLDRLTANVIALMACLLFTYNFGAVLFPCITNYINGEKYYKAKNDFIIEHTDERPNIYWLHMDGMMGFQTLEKNFGDKQKTLKDRLISNGFLLNENATLDIGWTAYAFPSLTSPYLYDSLLKTYFNGMRGWTDHERQDVLNPYFSVFDTYSGLELFTSLKQADYSTYTIIYDLGRGTENVPDNYCYKDSFAISKKANIIELYADYSFACVLQDVLHDIINRHLNIEEKDSYKEEIFTYVNRDSYYQFKTITHYDWLIAEDFENVLSEEGPKILYIQNLISHFPYTYDECGVLVSSNGEHDMSVYLSQHKYAEKVMLGMIDRIIEEDPNAVIVIQGDHGVHYFTREEFAEQGFTDEQMLEMNYSTISAVRIPEKYGSLTEPLDPLDITRYLVNHFVGEGNYDYLYYHEEE